MMYQKGESFLKVFFDEGVSSEIRFILRAHKFYLRAILEKVNLAYFNIVRAYFNRNQKGAS